LAMMNERQPVGIVIRPLSIATRSWSKKFFPKILKGLGV
jgi:hypothetical protein